MALLTSVVGFGLLVFATAPLSPGQNGQLAPEIEQSLMMRANWRAPIPKGDATIYVHSVGVHHIKTDQSTIAWRDRQGGWSISQIIQDGPGGLLRIEKELTEQDEKKLSAADGQRLDKLLRDQELFKEKPRRTGTIGVGAPFHVMEIVSPSGRVVTRWDGRLRGRLGRVADLVLGRE
jgi:hypothetical protein